MGLTFFAYEQHLRAKSIHKFVPRREHRVSTRHNQRHRGRDALHASRSNSEPRLKAKELPASFAFFRQMKCSSTSCRPFPEDRKRTTSSCRPFTSCPNVHDKQLSPISRHPNVHDKQLSPIYQKPGSAHQPSDAYFQKT